MQSLLFLSRVWTQPTTYFFILMLLPYLVFTFISTEIVVTTNPTTIFVLPCISYLFPFINGCTGDLTVLLVYIYMCVCVCNGFLFIFLFYLSLRLLRSELTPQFSATSDFPPVLRHRLFRTSYMPTSPCRSRLLPSSGLSHSIY